MSRLDEAGEELEVQRTSDVADAGRTGTPTCTAYEQALREYVADRCAPWYAIPADDKPFMRATVAGIVVDALESLGLHYPEVGDDDRAHFAEARAKLERS